MSDPFATALAALFRAPGSVAAAYTDSQGQYHDPIRVIRDQQTVDMQFGDTSVPAKSSKFSIQRIDVDQPIAGDFLTIDGEDFTIIGTPRLDDEGLSWTVEAPPA